LKGEQSRSHLPQSFFPGGLLVLLVARVSVVLVVVVQVFLAAVTRVKLLLVAVAGKLQLFAERKAGSPFHNWGN
jgi:hypothetical protein